MNSNNTITKETYPLNDAQRGVYFDFCEEPDSTKYNNPFVLELSGQIDLGKFADAVQNVFFKHPSFSATIAIIDGSPVMVRGKSKCIITYSSADSFEEATEDFVQPFNIEKGPLYRFEICQLPDKNLFLFDVQHLIYDGTSFRTFLLQISAAYDGKEIPDESMTLFEAACHEEHLKDTPEYHEAQEYFKNKFENVEFENEIIPDFYPEKDAQICKGGSVITSSLGLFSNEELELLSEKYGITKNVIFTAAFAITESLFAGTEDSCFTMGSNGRHGSIPDDTMGMFVKTLPLHFEIHEEQKVSDFLLQVKQDIKDAIRYEDISFMELVSDYGVNNKIAYVYQSEIISELKIGETEVVPKELPIGDIQSDVICMVSKKKDHFDIILQYDATLFTEKLMQGFSNTLLKIVQGILKEEFLGDIEYISTPDREFLDLVNSTEKEIDLQCTVNSAFETAVKKYADNTALVFKKNKYTYKEFDRLTKNVAAFISSQNIGADDFVAILAPRTDINIIAAWGVIRAGAAYQPMDPTYPAERLNFMIGDSKAKMLIVDKELRDQITEFDGIVVFTEDILTMPEAETFSASVKPENDLALIYTSGTTGNPKGCVLENRNIYSFFVNHKEIMELDENSNYATYASFGFDAGLMDLISVLLSGAVLFVIPDEIRLDFEKIDEFFCEHRITHSFMTTQIARMFAGITKCDTIKTLLTGGEKLVPFTPPQNLRFINAYGPCETMAYICCHQVSDNSPLQPIGKPNSNTKFFITDKKGRLMPIGAPGELCISGYQVGRGYLNLPEKTNSVFIENTFCSEPGFGRMYKSGDIIRMLTDGNLEFIGRKDGQVKIRGFRIELTEIEEVILRYEGIKDATVIAFELPSGGKAIAAYIVSDSQINIRNLNDFIRNEKPDYMVPAVTMQIDEIPYNQNQKVNKRALPAPRKEDAETVITVPQSDTQKKIYDIAVSVLGRDDFGITTDLFEAGMTSVSTLQFNMELGKVFDKPVKISDIRNLSTIEALAEFISGEKICIETDVKEDSYPLMQNQLGVFFECNLDPEAVRYNIPFLMKVSEKLDTEKLKGAIRTAINAHPYLKGTIFADAQGEFRIKRNDGTEADVEIIETEVLPSKEELVQPFEIMGGQLYRAKIYKTKEGLYMFIDIHHVVADGTSFGILINDINAAYDGNFIEKETFTGFDACTEEAEEMASDRFIKADEYYRNLLEGCDNECLPNKCPETDADTACVYETKYFEKASDVISKYCKDHNVTDNAFFNAVFSYTLARFLHADDITYCTVYNGRNDARLFNCVSMLVKTLPVRCMMDMKEKPLDFVTAMQNQLMDSMSNDIVPFSAISSKNNLKADLFFIYQGDNFVFDKIGNENAAQIDIEIKDAKAPLTIEILLEGDRYKAQASYRPDYFCREFVSSFLDGIMTAAEGFTKVESLEKISLLSEREREFFNEMNDTYEEFERVAAHVFMEREAKKNPERIAVQTKETSLTYKELNEKANAVANRLISLGCNKDEIVGLILDRDERIPICQFGINKAGGAFLPMLPTYPGDRIEYCLKDAGCRYVITTREIYEKHKELASEELNCKVLFAEDLINGTDVEMPSLEVAEDALVYCIYTSGSTGTPKGVMIEHHNLSCFIQLAPLRATESHGNVILCAASIAFDMSVSEIYFSLSMGKTIYIATEEEVHNFDLLLEAFEKYRIDVMFETPSFLWALLSIPGFKQALSNMKGLTVGAEAFQEGLLPKLKELNKDMIVQNGYGPSECTMACSAKTLETGDRITIGKPFPNAKYYIMDDDGNLLPRYAVGELIICGEGVGRGYIKLPEKNAAAFLEIDGVRAYHSGDLAYVNRDNETEYVGRADSQVKLRGFRVELGEVESVIEEFEGVTRSKVIVRNNGTEDFLAAFFTADREIDIDALTAHMRTKLTYYMVPAAIMQLEKMPMTANGKLDAKNLPEIKPRKKERSRQTPKKSLEEKIVHLFKDILDFDEVYADDNFFEIGGTSLSASKVVMQLKGEGYEIEYQDIFDHQSAEELAKFLEPASVEVIKETSGDLKGIVNQDERITKLLYHNRIEYADQVKRTSLGDLLLTGAAGFLGMHIIKAFLETEEGKVICLLRKGGFDNVRQRIQAGLVYYFEDDFDAYFDERIICVEGDITDENLIEQLKDVHFDTLINCAASVKHYAKDNSIEFINVHGVENLIQLSKEKQTKMIQISTTSVSGAHNEETYRSNLKMRECDLFVIDDLNNQYCQSKLKSELLMLDAIESGMKGKIIRVGNLMGRYSDGEFQANSMTNAFLSALRGFVHIGKCPIGQATDQLSFSPIDCTAKAVVLLAGTNDEFTAFNVESRSTFDEMKMMEALSNCGLKVAPVDDKEFYDDFYRMMADPESNEKLSALLTNNRPGLHMVEADNRFTAGILYRLGFSWPFIENDYLERVIRSLDALDFFFR